MTLATLGLALALAVHPAAYESASVPPQRWWEAEAPDLRPLAFSNAVFSPCVGQMKGCIKVLKEQPSNSVEGLLNALRCV